MPSIEPLGLLSGSEGQAALATGVGRLLAGGPVVFTMVRIERRVFALSSVPAAWLGELGRLSDALPDWAGLGDGPLVMGILNITPDSFSDGGRYLDPGAAIAAGERMLAAGVDLLDVGGESTRPGSQPVEPRVEQARVLPVIRALARQGAVISIDSRSAATMERALDEGARVVNDVSALSHDPNALPLVAARACPVILMHMRGTPATMGGLTDYNDVALDVANELALLVTRAETGGVRRSNITIDPGFGFAKTAAQNIELLSRLPVLCGLGLPIVVGASRKSTIGQLSGEVDARKLGPGSLAASLFAVARSARVVRVHDAADTVQALRAWRGLNGT